MQAGTAGEAVGLVGCFRAGEGVYLEVDATEPEEQADGRGCAGALGVGEWDCLGVSWGGVKGREGDACGTGKSEEWCGILGDGF